MKKTKVISITAFVLLLYIIIGSSLPFIRQPKYKVSKADAVTAGKIYGQSDGLRAGIVETNEEALTIRLRMIKDAKKRIVLSTFDIRPGKSSDDIFGALLAAADRGVKVQILVDGLYGTLHMAKESDYYAAGSHSNIEIRFYNVPNLLKPWTIHGRLHDKYLLVDDDLLLSGGRNTFDYFLGSYSDSASFDREVLIYKNTKDNKKEVIKDTYDYFEGVWNLKVCKPVFEKTPFYIKDVRRAREKLLSHYLELKEQKKDIFDTTSDYEKLTVPIDNAVLLANPTHIYAKEPVVFSELVALMKGSRERVFIQTPYAVFSKDMYKEITEAVKAQPNIKMLLNSTAVGDNFMASSDYTLNRKKITATGINLYEFYGSHSIHAKSIVIDDDISAVMSYNLDMRSTYIDTEVALVIRGKEFNRLLEANMEMVEKESLKVKEDESYASNASVQIKELTPAKKTLFSITSVVFQLFRFLL
ncbi:Phosphatidylserine/phosphatidylglycerophosphate/cardiolipin synthase [Anaerocolumna jejuensis DSM 15929]|uniref:Phosphatidylserine/phosphatidylglycerophosphate/cardiolipin synthase n=1 Tax=Anaerocolumna jejuensis DSM 15929 TaxID=1121322 RepID=A0A1M6LT46_9FIRM|nr:phospholipase D family protein [Anaerocolumna jejuensis]SHJ74373.1 Phosphatidylserine/phosphatidylglycerophosphate/cardiolipin synthase [Anaerocolumna jejuensis DSM 15929]